MDQQIKRLIVLQATNRFLIETAYHAVFAFMPAEARADLVRDLRDRRSRLTAISVTGAPDNASAKEELNAMIEADLSAFADRLESPAVRN